MPFQPQLYDIETLGSLKDVLTLAGNPPAAVFVNRAPIQGKRHTETLEAAAAQGFTVCPVVIFARAAHGDAGNIGQTAAEYEPDSKAAQEIAELYAYSSIALKGGTTVKKSALAAGLKAAAGHQTTTAPAPAGVNRAKGKKAGGTVLIGAHYLPEVRRTLLLVQAEPENTGKTLKRLLGEAINDLCAKYGKPQPYNGKE